MHFSWCCWTAVSLKSQYSPPNGEAKINKISTDAALLTAHFNINVCYDTKWDTKVCFQCLKKPICKAHQPAKNWMMKLLENIFPVAHDDKDDKMMTKGSYSWVPVFWPWAKSWTLTDPDDFLSASQVAQSQKGSLWGLLFSGVHWKQR